ncbi:MAG: hypothetical protein ACFFCI_24110 [Promethearchaeota archaeon]
MSRDDSYYDWNLNLMKEKEPQEPSILIELHQTPPYDLVLLHHIIQLFFRILLNKHKTYAPFLRRFFFFFFSLVVDEIFGSAGGIVL